MSEIEQWKKVALESNTFLLLCLHRFGKQMDTTLIESVRAAVADYDRLARVPQENLPGGMQS